MLRPWLLAVIDDYCASDSWITLVTLRSSNMAMENTPFSTMIFVLKSPFRSWISSYHVLGDTGGYQSCQKKTASAPGNQSPRPKMWRFQHSKMADDWSCLRVLFRKSCHIPSFTLGCLGCAVCIPLFGSMTGSSPKKTDFSSKLLLTVRFCITSKWFSSI